MNKDTVKKTLDTVIKDNCLEAMIVTITTKQNDVIFIRNNDEIYFNDDSLQINNEKIILISYSEIATLIVD